MRPLLLSIGAGSLAVGVALAQTKTGGDTPQLPVGQTYKDFQFPIYDQGQLKATLSAVEAKGVTLNKAEATDLKIDLYDEGKVTTTITSPKADLYIADRTMRTKNTVLVERTDGNMEASAQTCDFDLITKKYLLRENVKVTLKNFDAALPTGTSSSSPTASTTPAPGSNTPGLPAPLLTEPKQLFTPSLPHSDNSLLDSPGAYATTNIGPIAPSNPVTP